MNKYEYGACRNLIAGILHQALKDVAYGPLKDKIEAKQFVDGRDGEHVAEILGINKWPPEKDCYDRLRTEHLNRKAWMWA
jgi:hypothetical protein